MPELAEDIAGRVAQNEARLVPTTGQIGHYLGVTGQSPFSYAFLQPPDEEIPRFPGSPDGELAAPIDSLVRNTDDHTVWINTDGDTAWQLVGSGGDSFWEIDSGAHEILQPRADLTGDGTIEYVEIELEGVQGGDTHHTYFYVAPGIGAGGGDIQAETYIVGHDAVMDWLFWSRQDGVDGWEAGMFFNAIGDDEAGNKPEVFLQTFADANFADIEHYADTDVTAWVELDVTANSLSDVAYIQMYGKDAFLLFRETGGTPFGVAPDAEVAIGDWSIGYDGSDIIIKVNDSSVIKTVVLTPT